MKGFVRVIHCVTCNSHLEVFARRARCVFDCGAWYCRRRKEGCREIHMQTCPGLNEPVSPT